MGKTSAAFNIIFGAKTGKLSKDLKGVQRQMTILQRNLQNTGRKLTVGLTAPLAAIGTSAFRTAAQFEESMAKVAAVSGATGSQLKELQQLALDLGKSTVFTASDVAGLEESFARLGFSTREIVNATEATLNLAQASGTDLSNAADVAGSTLRAFGLDAAETNRVTDVMAKSFSETALDVDSFQEAMKTVAPVAASAGLSVEQTTALLGSLANSGIRGSRAGTALRRIISELGTTSGDVAGEIERLAAQGLDLADAKDEVGRNAQSALLILAEATGTTKDLTASFKDADGSAKRMADTMNDTAAGSMKRMQSAVEGAQIALGSALAPSVTAAADAIARLAERFSNLSESTQKTIAGLGIFAASIGPVSSGLGVMVGGVKNAIKGLKALRLVILANPIGALATALLAVGTAAITFLSTTDNMTEAQREQLRVTREQNLELAEQARLLKEAMNIEVNASSIKDLQGAVGSLNKELDAFSTEKLQQGLTIDLDAKPFQQIKLGEEFSEINPQSRKEIKERLQSSLSILTSEAVGQGLFGDEAVSFIQERLRERLGGIIGDYRSEILAKRDEVQSALTDLIAADAGNGGTVTITPEVADTPKFETDDELAKVFEQLAEAENAAVSAQALTGDVKQAAEDLASAYFQAAQGAAELGQIDLASQLYAQAQAFEANADAVSMSADEVREAIESRLYDLDTDVAIRLNLDGDTVAAFTTLADGYKSAAFEAAQLGNVELSEHLYQQAQAFEAQGQAAQNAADRTKIAAQASQEALQGLAQGAMAALQTVGSGFAQAQENYRQGIIELNAAFGEQQLSAEEYAEREKELEKQRQRERSAAAMKAIDTFLAEAMAAMISAAMKSAATAGPGAALLAPVLAAGATAAVRAAFAGIPAFAEGGAVMGGPTLALLGDNPSGREMIVPFEKLPQFLNMFQQKTSTDVTVHGILQGRDIHISSQKSQRLVQRTNAAMAF